MTQLMERDETALAAYEETEANGWGAGTEDVTPTFPTITLIQKTMPDIPGSERESGRFHLSDGIFTEKVTGWIVWTGKSRALFDDEDGAERVPICAADDAVHPREGSTLWEKGYFTEKGMTEPTNLLAAFGIPLGQMPTNCQTCPLQKWADGPGGKRVAPPCKESFRTVLVDGETGNVYRFAFRGAAVGGFRRFLGLLRGQGFNIRGGSGEDTPTYGKTITIAPKRVDDKQHDSVYWTPEIAIVGPTPADTMPDLRNIARMIAQSARRAEPVDDDTDEAAQPAPPFALGNVPPDNGRDYSAFWADIDGLGYTREQREDVLSMIAPAASLAEIGEEEMWGLIPQISTALNGAKPSEMDLGERRVVVEKVKAMRNPLPEVTPADLTPRSDVTAAKQERLK